MFLALKNLFFRPKKIFLDFLDLDSFLDFLDLKISLNPLKTLRKHLFSLQIDEKNNIFFRLYSKNDYYIIMREPYTSARDYLMTNFSHTCRGIVRKTYFSSTDYTVRSHSILFIILLSSCCNNICEYFVVSK